MTPEYSARMRRGFALRMYLLASHAIAPLAGPILRRRLARGKENPDRWREKRGQNLAERPAGTLVWLHGVGLGEVMALRGLIAAMATAKPDLSFLVTSTTAASAAVFSRNLPPRTLHQFLPLDAPSFRRRFLNHFQPDLCIWNEQDLWPGFISDLAARKTPQAVVAARMNAVSFTRHRRASGLFNGLYRAMALVTAQDDQTADHLRQLGAAVSVTGSLKPAAPPLRCDDDALAALRSAVADRFVWAVAPAHPEDARIAMAAHERLRETKPDALLIIAPRFPQTWQGGDLPRRSTTPLPRDTDPAWVCDSFGQLGLIYRITEAVLIGGTFSKIEGHNPWEAAMLDNAILHGPRYANFATDFAQLQKQSGAKAAQTPDDITTALTGPDLPMLKEGAAAAVKDAAGATHTLAADLLRLLEPAK